jgi:hypothetical protein
VIKKIIISISSFIVMVLLCLPMLPAAAQIQEVIKVTSSSAKVSFPLQLNFNLSAQSDTTVTDIRLRYRIEQESFATVNSEAYVVFAPSTSVNVQYALDMRETGGLPPGVKVDYWWVIKNAAGVRVETSPVSIQFDDNRYKWQKINDGLINIYWYSGNTEFANALMATAKAALEKLAQNTGAVITKPIKIYVYASTQDLLGALIYPYEWTGAVTYSQYNTIAIGLQPSNLEWGKAATAHELSHLAIYQVTMNPYNELPRWLDEGLAVYAEGIVDVSFSTALYNAVISNSLISVRSLASPFSADSKLASLSYGESFSIVDFLISTYGQDKMLALLTIFHQGSTYDNALRQVYGFDMTGLDTLWRKYVNELYNPTKTAGVKA